jgi:hypothetical protein
MDGGIEEKIALWNSITLIHDAGASIWSLADRATLDPDHALPSRTGPTCETIQKLQEALTRIGKIPPRILMTPGQDEAALVNFLRECRFLATSLDRLREVLEQLAKYVPSLRRESVPLKREMEALGDLAAKMVNVETGLAEYVRLITSRAERGLVDRSLIFVTESMRDFESDCLIFRGRLNFSYLKAGERAKMEAA